jgi:hypothetical protein
MIQKIQRKSSKYSTSHDQRHIYSFSSQWVRWRLIDQFIGSSSSIHFLSSFKENLPIDEIKTREIKFTRFHQHKIHFVDLYLLLFCTETLSLPIKASRQRTLLSNEGSLKIGPVLEVSFFHTTLCSIASMFCLNPESSNRYNIEHN